MSVSPMAVPPGAVRPNRSAIAEPPFDGAGGSSHASSEANASAAARGRRAPPRARGRRRADQTPAQHRHAHRRGSRVDAPITSPAPGKRGISSRPSADTMRSIRTPLTTVHARTQRSPCRIAGARRQGRGEGEWLGVQALRHGHSRTEGRTLAAGCDIVGRPLRRRRARLRGSRPGGKRETTMAKASQNPVRRASPCSRGCRTKHLKRIRDLAEEAGTWPAPRS